MARRATSLLRVPTPRRLPRYQVLGVSSSIWEKLVAVTFSRTRLVHSMTVMSLPTHQAESPAWKKMRPICRKVCRKDSCGKTSKKENGSSTAMHVIATATARPVNARSRALYRPPMASSSSCVEAISLSSAAHTLEPAMLRRVSASAATAKTVSTAPMMGSKTSVSTSDSTKGARSAVVVLTPTTAPVRIHSFSFLRTDSRSSDRLACTPSTAR
mmetsp:Transcript_79047/g.232076  ORF Transcript_79047/g.232076 Transcript_79047/m.232076 type:complete len:214 (+) Transcript_79047:635-1276(+)